MTWFSHRCHFCGHKSREVAFIAGDANWQCENREECVERRRQKLTARFGLPDFAAVGPFDTKLGKNLGLWS